MVWNFLSVLGAQSVSPLPGDDTFLSFKSGFKMRSDSAELPKTRNRPWEAVGLPFGGWCNLARPHPSQLSSISSSWTAGLCGPGFRSLKIFSTPSCFSHQSVNHTTLILHLKQPKIEHCQTSLYSTLKSHHGGNILRKWSWLFPPLLNDHHKPKCFRKSSRNTKNCFRITLPQ